MNLYPLHIATLNLSRVDGIRHTKPDAKNKTEDIVFELKSCLKSSNNIPRNRMYSVRFADVNTISSDLTKSSSYEIESESFQGKNTNKIMLSESELNLFEESVDFFTVMRDESFGDISGNKKIKSRFFSTEINTLESNPFGTLNKMFEELSLNKETTYHDSGMLDGPCMGVWYNSRPDGSLRNSFSDSDCDTSYGSSSSSDGANDSMTKKERSRWVLFKDLMSSMFNFRG